MVLINVDYVSTPEIRLWICNAFRISTYEVSARPCPVDSTIGICSFARGRYRRHQAKKRVLGPNDSKIVLNCRPGKRMNK